jgi:hypothetical protein
MIERILSKWRGNIARSDLLLGVLAIVAVQAGQAEAALLVYEPFDYADDTVLDTTPATGQNLIGAYQSFNPGLPNQFQLSAQSPGLDYGNLSGAPTSAGNKVAQAQGTTANAVTVAVNNDVVINAGQTIYWSALLRLDDSLNGNHRASVTFTDQENGDTLQFGEPTVGVRGVRVEADTAATGQLIAAGADQSFANGDTLFLIGRYVNSAAAGGDRLDLVGYDTADADVLPGAFDPADPNAEFTYELSGLDIDMTKITSITFTIRATNNNFIDELRIGSTYGSIVIPEPATGVLALVAAVAQLVPRRREVHEGVGKRDASRSRKSVAPLSQTPPQRRRRQSAEHQHLARWLWNRRIIADGDERFVEIRTVIERALVAG